MIRPYRGSTIPSSLQPIMPCLICRLLQNYFPYLHKSQWVDTKQNLKLSKVLFTSKQVGSLSVGLNPAFAGELFQVTLRLPRYLRLNSNRSVSININKRGSNFSRNIHGARMFPRCFPVSHTGNIVSRVSFCFQDLKLRLRYTAGNFDENPNMRALAKILRARASEHSSNLCEQFEQRPNFESTFQLTGTIRYP